MWAKKAMIFLILIYTLRLLIFGFVGIVSRNSYVAHVRSCCLLIKASRNFQNAKGIYTRSTSKGEVKKQSLKIR